MRKNSVIDSSNLPGKLPVFPTLSIILALDHWDAAGWVWGALGALLLIIWIGTIMKLVNQDVIDIFGETSEGVFKEKKEYNFKERLQKAMKKNGSN